MYCLINGEIAPGPVVPFGSPTPVTGCDFAYTYKPGNFDPAAKEIDAVTQSIDVIPSLLSFHGHAVPEGLPGTDIFLGQPRGSSFAEIHGGWALIQDRYKLINTQGSSFLSDHHEDPEEQANLALRNAQQLESMRNAVTALRQWVAIRPQEAPVKEHAPSPEAIEALKSLGYLQ